MRKSIEEHRTFIYGLCCPDTGTIRYVGKSDNPEARFKQHRNAARGKYSQYQAAKWFRALLVEGKQPTLTVIEECGELEWQEREKHWIKTLREQGNDLLNKHAGGGGSCLRWSEAWSVRYMEWLTNYHPDYQSEERKAEVRREEQARAAPAEQPQEQTP